MLVAHRHAREIDQVQQVRVDELGRQVEREHVEVARGTVGVDAEQRQTPRPQRRLHVGPRRVGALGDGVVALVQDLVKDLEPLVGEADLVGVGVDQEESNPAHLVVRPLAASLHSDVASGLLHPGQERFDPRPQVRHLPLSLAAGPRPAARAGPSLSGAGRMR